MVLAAGALCVTRTAGLHEPAPHREADAAARRRAVSQGAIHQYRPTRGAGNERMRCEVD